MKRFVRMMQPTPDTTILDVGGCEDFWAMLEIEPRVTLLNVRPEPGNRFRRVLGDGCSLPFADQSFDMVFSNSVIEHVGGWERQQRFAEEVRRVGRRYWVQTPDIRFPIEPHLLAPFIHWLPRAARYRLAGACTPWAWLTKPSLEQVRAVVDEIRLLSAGEMAILFPGATLVRERLLGLSKSVIAVS